MATARKLPSGSWRCRVYDYTDEAGKKHYHSFTCDDPSPKGKRKCELMAAEFAADKERAVRDFQDFTLSEAMNKYLSDKSNILSPSTIRGYRQMQTYFKSIEHLRLSEITQQDVDRFVNNFSINHSPKTVRNAHGFLTAVLAHNRCDLVLRTKLPQKVIPTYTLPTDANIRSIMDYTAAHDMDMYIAICLAAFGTLRRSEICALTADDVSGNQIHVHSAMVQDETRHWVIKTTKTVSSDRYIDLPASVAHSLPESGRLVNISPNIITVRFSRILKRTGCPHFRFHDLRHYSASIMHAIGVPDAYIMERGGWRTDTVLKQVYRGTLEEYQKKYTEMTNQYFEKI